MGKLSVGFMGGSSFFELGSVGDMELFFTCLRALDNSTFDESWSEFLDRLYCSYIDISKLNEARRLMDEAFDFFQNCRFCLLK